MAAVTKSGAMSEAWGMVINGILFNENSHGPSDNNTMTNYSYSAM